MSKRTAGGGGPEAQLTGGVEIRDLDALDEEADAVDIGCVVVGLDCDVGGLLLVDDAAEGGPGPRLGEALVAMKIGVVADHTGLHDGGVGALNGRADRDVNSVGRVDVHGHGGRWDVDPYATIQQCQHVGRPIGHGETHGLATDCIDVQGAAGLDVDPGVEGPQAGGLVPQQRLVGGALEDYATAVCGGVIGVGDDAELDLVIFDVDDL